MKLRTTVVTAAVSAVAAMAATGITYASAASAPAPQKAPAVAAAVPNGGGGGNGNGNGNSKGNEGNEDHEGNKGNKGNNYGGYEGRIEINERSYFAHPGDCITVVSGLGARSLNIRNDSRKTVEVFRGAVCDNGAPIATVGPHSSSNGVHPGCVRGIDIDHGVLASFRVIKDHYGNHGEDY